MIRTLSLESRSEDGMVEVVEIGEDPESESIMRELGWQRIIHGTAWPAAVTSSTRKEEVFVGDRETASASTRGLNGSPGFTPAGELEVGTPPGRLFSEAVDALLPGLAKEFGNGANANADAHVAAILTVMNMRFGRSF